MYKVFSSMTKDGHGKLFTIHSKIIAVTMFIFNFLMQEIMAFHKHVKGFIV